MKTHVDPQGWRSALRRLFDTLRHVCFVAFCFTVFGLVAYVECRKYWPVWLTSAHNQWHVGIERVLDAAKSRTETLINKSGDIDPDWAKQTDRLFVMMRSLLRDSSQDWKRVFGDGRNSPPPEDRPRHEAAQLWLEEWESSWVKAESVYEKDLEDGPADGQIRSQFAALESGSAMRKYLQALIECTK